MQTFKFKSAKLGLLTLVILACSFPLAANFPVKASSISYPVVELKLPRGGYYDGTVDINFAVNDPDTLYLTTERLDTADVSGISVSYKVGPTENTLANWIELDRTTIFKPEGVTYTNGDNVVKVPYEVYVPDNAEPGSHYAVIVVSEKIDATRPNTVGVSNDVTLTILLTVEGETISRGNLEWFRTKDNQVVYSRLPAEFEAKFVNNGNVHIIPRGNIEIFAGGVKIDRISLNPKQERTLPDKSRVYTRPWSEEGVEELIDAKAIEDMQAKLPTNFFEEVLYQITHFRIGIFNAELQGFAGSKSYKANVSFVVIPWQLLLVIAVILLIFIMAIRSQWQLRRLRAGSTTYR